MRAYTILCDELAHHHDTQVTFIGTYTDLIVVDKFPEKLNHLMVCTCFHFEPGEQLPEKIIIRVEKKLQNDYVFDIEVEGLPDRKFYENLEMPINVSMNNLIFSDETPLIVSYSINGGDFVVTKVLETLDKEQMAARAKKFKEKNISLSIGLIKPESDDE